MSHAAICSDQPRAVVSDVTYVIINRESAGCVIDNNVDCTAGTRTRDNMSLQTN